MLWPAGHPPQSRNPTPTGTVVVAKNALVPYAVDAGINRHAHAPHQH